MPRSGRRIEQRQREEGRKEGEKGVRANTNGDRLGSLNRTGAKGLLLRGREGGGAACQSVGKPKGDFRKEPYANKQATCKFTSQLYIVERNLWTDGKSCAQ